MKSDSFKDFVLDQMTGLGDVSARAMFGGWGLWRDGAFFGIIWRGRLYFKTSPETRDDYTDRGMKPFRPGKNKTLKNYFEVPVDVIEDPGTLVQWALKSPGGR